MHICRLVLAVGVENGASSFHPGRTEVHVSGLSPHEARWCCSSPATPRRSPSGSLTSRAGEVVAEAFPADIEDVEQVLALGAAIRERVGVLDVVVNNAGAGRFLYLEETEPHELETMTAMSYSAALFVTQEFLPDMLHRRSGWIVNVNSPVSRMLWAGATGYAGARWALRGLAAALRQDLRGTGVGASEVVPAKVDSEYFVNNPGAEQRVPKVDALIPRATRSAGRHGCPGEPLSLRDGVLGRAGRLREMAQHESSEPVGVARRGWSR